MNVRVAVILALAVAMVACGGTTTTSAGLAIGTDAQATASDVAMPASEAVSAAGSGDVQASVDAAGTPVDAGPSCKKSKLRPPPRAEMMGVFDPKRRRLVIWGGDSGVPVCGSFAGHQVGVADLWIYDAVCATFEQVQTAVTPPARARGMAVYDPDRDQMVLFGGRYRKASSGSYTVFNDAWALDLETLTWKELQTTGPKPPARSTTAGGYNSVTGEMLLFGGNGSGNGLQFISLDDTWALNLETLQWRQVEIQGSKPSKRQFHTAVVDAPNNRMFVHGGGGANAWQGPFLGDLWMVDLIKGSWNQLHAGGVGAPKGRIWSTLTYDPLNKKVLLFGGHDDGNVGNNNDTWGYDLTSGKWQNVTKAETVNKAPPKPCDFAKDFTLPNMMAPDRRSAHLAALDLKRGEWIVFGGKTDCGLIDDVWVFDLERYEWVSQLSATQGEACIRGDNPDLCVAMCSAPK